MTNEVKRSFEISRLDEEQRMVYGIACTDQEASDGYVVTREAIAEAWPDYMKFANVREMHQEIAAGVVRVSEMTDVGMMVGAYIADEGTWGKVKAGVLKAFSIRGPILEAVGNIVNRLRIIELSLVDRPADPGAVVTMFRADGAGSTEAGQQPQGDSTMSTADRQALVAAKPGPGVKRDDGMLMQAAAVSAPAEEQAEINIMSELGAHLDAIGALVGKFSSMHEGGGLSDEVMAHCQNAHRAMGRAMASHVKSVTSYGAKDEGEPDGDEAKRSITPFKAGPSKIDALTETVAELARSVESLKAKPELERAYQPVLIPETALRSLDKAEDIVRADPDPEDKDPKEDTPEFAALPQMVRFEITDRRNKYKLIKV